MNTEKSKYELLMVSLNKVNKKIEETNKRLESLLKNIDKGINTPYSIKDKYITIEKGLKNISNNIEMNYIPEIERQKQKIT